MNFLNKAKTEREFIVEATKMAQANGYKDIAEIEKLQPGDKIYFINRGKSMYLAIIGTENIENGIHIIGSHVDSPRLDLKPNPLYEDTELAYFKNTLLWRNQKISMDNNSIKHPWSNSKTKW